MEEETIRRPDSTRRECLVPSSSSLPSRSRPYSRRGSGSNNNNHSQSRDEAVITWEEDAEDADLKEALRQSALEADALAVREADRLEAERIERERVEEAERVERELQRYGFVQSRLRLMEHPSDPIPSRLLDRIRWECAPAREKPSSTPPPPSPEEKEWVQKRAEKSPPFGVLLDLLEKK